MAAEQWSDEYFGQGALAVRGRQGPPRNEEHAAGMWQAVAQCNPGPAERTILQQHMPTAPGLPRVLHCHRRLLAIRSRVRLLVANHRTACQPAYQHHWSDDRQASSSAG